MNKINIPNIIFLISAIVVILVIIEIVATLVVNKKINKEIQQMESGIAITNEKITYDDIKELPEPVKKWLLSINILGEDKYNLISFSQKGKMYLSSEQTKPYKSNAKQYVRIDKPSFLWFVNVKFLPFLNIRGIDNFDSGIGSMKMLLASVFPVVNELNNYRLNESSLSRFLLELPWYPSAAIENYITWEEVDIYSAKATINYKDMKSEVIYYFDENYDLVKMEGLRFKDTSDNSKRILCIGEVVDSKIVNGIRIPNKINVSWFENGTKFTWYEIENYDFYYY